MRTLCRRELALNGQGVEQVARCGWCALTDWARTCYVVENVYTLSVKETELQIMQRVASHALKKCTAQRLRFFVAGVGGRECDPMQQAVGACWHTTGQISCSS